MRGRSPQVLLYQLQVQTFFLNILSGGQQETSI